MNTRKRPNSLKLRWDRIKRKIHHYRVCWVHPLGPQAMGNTDSRLLETPENHGEKENRAKRLPGRFPGAELYQRAQGFRCSWKD